MDVESHRDPSFGSIEEYARVLSLAYPAARPHALMRMARHGVRVREDGRFELKIDPALRGVFQNREDDEPVEEPAVDVEHTLWEALGRIPCPTRVVRGAASDILSADVADRMVDDVLADGTLAIVAQAGHSVMTDNPDGFREAVTSFVLAEE
jgi:pimeloyl-ACP methyl ester carboxylesterase